ncbi:ABC transporter substrate-binding protein [Arthrobacter rhombi]|uniref:ABC transporter substrate-binding protein n=1 Tax=Arthrobacter rhombi TaxID=71253 RepID=UPI003FD3C22E
MKRKFVALAVVGAFAVSSVGLTACSDDSSQDGSGAQGSGEIVRGGDLTIARAQDAKSMNNILTFDNTSIFIFEQIMEPLFTVTDDGKDTKPLLAESFEASSDKKTYTIQLKEGIKFSTGKEMTAEDVKFSIDQDTKHAETGWGFINEAIKEVKASGKYEVTVELKYPWAPIIADLALFSNAIVPKDYDGKTMEEFYKAPVGTGAFKWGEWNRGQQLKLVANDDYWQEDMPYLDSVTFKVVSDSNTRKLQVQGGQADIDEYPDWSSFKSLGSGSDITAKTFPSTQLDYLAFNQEEKPFQDVHVRRAISAMIDREAINKAVLFGNGTPANSLLMPGVPFYQKDTEGIKQNADLAKKELAKSSVPDGFSTSLLIPSGDASKLSTAQIIQNDLKEYGIKVEIKQLDPTANHNAQQNMQYEMGLSAWTMDIPDPDQWTNFAVNPDGGAKSAYTNYRSKEAMKLNSQAQRETDHDKRAKLYDQLQDVTAEEAPFAYLYYSPYAYGISTKVHNFKVTPLGNYPLMDVWKSK